MKSIIYNDEQQYIYKEKDDGGKKDERLRKKMIRRRRRRNFTPCLFLVRAPSSNRSSYSNHALSQIYFSCVCAFGPYFFIVVLLLLNIKREKEDEGQTGN